MQGAASRTLMGNTGVTDPGVIGPQTKLVIVTPIFKKNDGKTDLK